MYSVLRVTSDGKPELRQIEELGKELNQVLSGAFGENEERGDGSTVEVSESMVWEEQRKSIIKILKQGN